ncbi:MAG: glycosyltransferase family 2 protein [Thermoflexales bacterium]|nr:glycosyltransferase family 2 protein [Thermoflexales bacterium]MCS7325144.1 glycosyltransferase family 2 protein [Thermoflexales bacterium]MDW8054457.1 glycosyltransferase family 2 protein [Anaerolineae bacterium]MDW8292753.1 glycosyltransferase family 2 protein [Anaerolineae bacterium]
MKLSIIMPVFNEAATIAEILDRVARVDLSPIEKEIVLVDDCSKDATPDILRQQTHIPNLRVITHEVNGGKGAAIQTALQHITGDIVIIQDADLEYDPNDYARLIAPIVRGEAKVVYGVRDLSSQRWYMALGNRFVTLATNLLYGVKLHDMETCYKTMAREVVEGLKLECRRFDVEAEITAKIIRRGYRIVEVPIHYQARYEEKKLSPLDGIPTLKALLKYRNWKG